jgi:hypothetical protein
MIPEPLPDRIQVHSLAVKKLLYLAIGFAAIGAASAREVIDGVRGVEAFVIKEGGDESRKASPAANPPVGCHLANEEV